ncbi:MAG: calcium-binding protein [Pseudomonadota bacterium]
MTTKYGTNGSDLLTGTQFEDTLFGLAGNDLLYGYGGGDFLVGGAGDDTAFGGSGNDNISGDQGDDSLVGGAGDDMIRGGSGDDTMLGGDDDDWLEGGAGGDWMQGDAGNDTADYTSSTGTVWVTLNAGLGFYGHAQGDRLFNIENLRGSQYTDWLQGDARANKIEGQDGNDVIEGLAGDDMLQGGAGNDQIDGGSGNDSLYGDAGDDNLFGGADDDWLAPGLGDATIDGGDGIDTLDLRVSNDFCGWTVDLAEGTGSRLKPFLINMPGSGEDAETASIDRAETLTHGTGLEALLDMCGLWPFPNRKLAADAPAPAADGEPGGQTETEISWTTGGNSMGLLPFPDEPMSDLAAEPFFTPEQMQAFSDTSLPLAPWFDDKPELFEPDLGIFNPKPADYRWELTIEGIENIVGSHGDDLLLGNALDNEIYGRLGDDVIEGRGGNDLIYDAWGNNTMQGGDGEDWMISAGGDLTAEMTGGADADHFIFVWLDLYALTPGSRGSITDFEQGDTIYLDDTTLPGPLNFIGGAAFDGTAPQARVAQSGATALVEIDRIGNGDADWSIELALQDPGHTLTAADFIML